MCLEGLRAVDRISYLQFAAVYKQLDVDQVRDWPETEPSG